MEIGERCNLESGMVVEEVEAKVNDATDRQFTVDEDMGFWQVPAPRPNKELGDLVVELVDPVPGLVMEGYGPIYSISKVDLASGLSSGSPSLVRTHPQSQPSERTLGQVRTKFAWA